RTDCVARQQQRSRLRVPQRQRKVSNETNQTIRAPLEIRRHNYRRIAQLMAYVIAEQRQQFGSIVEASVPAENVPVTRNQRLSIESRFTIRVKRAVYKTDRSAGHRIAAVWTMTLQLGA